jgi:hypothetical protein
VHQHADHVVFLADEREGALIPGWRAINAAMIATRGMELPGPTRRRGLPDASRLPGILTASRSAS